MRLASGEALARVVAFGLSIYLARTLGAAVYGTVALATAVLLYAGCVADCGLEMLGVRDVAAEPGQVPRIVPTLTLTRLLVAVAGIVLLVVFGLAFAPQPDGSVLAAYSLILLALALNTKWVVLGLGKSGTVGLARTAGEATAAIVAVLLVHDAGGVAWVPLAQLAGDSLAALLLLRALSREGLKLAVSWTSGVVRPVLRRSWPLVGHALLGLLIFNVDFFFLRAFRDTATVGRYAVAYTLVSFFTNLGVMYGFSLLPAITRLQDDPMGERALYDESMARAFAVALPVAIGASLLAHNVIELAFGERYEPSALALQILIWSVPIALFRNVAVGLLIARGRQHDVFLTTVWAATANLVLNATLIPRYGMAGAAAATVATEAMRSVTALRYAGKLGLPLTPLRRFWRPLLAGAVLAGAVLAWPNAGLLIGVPLGALAYGISLLALGGVQLVRGGLPRLSV